MDTPPRDPADPDFESDVDTGKHTFDWGADRDRGEATRFQDQHQVGGFDDATAAMPPLGMDNNFGQQDFAAPGPPGQAPPPEDPYGNASYGSEPYGSESYGTEPYGSEPHQAGPYGAGPYGGAGQAFTVGAQYDDEATQHAAPQGAPPPGPPPPEGARRAHAAPGEPGAVAPPPMVPLQESDTDLSWRERHGRKVTIGIVAAVVLALIAAFFIWRTVRANQFQDQLATAQQQAGEVVNDYLTAVEAGDAAAVQVTASSEPENALVTDPVLTRSNELGGLTQPSIGEVDIAHDARVRTMGTTGTVAVSYQVGDEPVEVKIPVIEQGGAWKVLEPTALVDFGSDDPTRQINGAGAGGQAVSLVPGTYEVSSSSPNLEYADSTLVVLAPGAVEGAEPIWNGGEPTLSEEGEEAVADAVRASMIECMSQKSLEPEGCPFAVNSDGIDIDAATIQYSLVGDPYQDMEVDYDPATNQASGQLEFSYTMTASGTQNGVEGDVTVDADAGQGAGAFVVDMSGEEPTVTWNPEEENDATPGAPDPDQPGGPDGEEAPDAEPGADAPAEDPAPGD